MQEEATVARWRTPMPKVTVQIDPSTCILAANCVGIEPKLFQIGQESYVELTNSTGISQGTEYTFEATDTDLEMIEEAVDSCPTRAISMRRESSISFVIGLLRTTGATFYGQ